MQPARPTWLPTTALGAALGAQVLLLFLAVLLRRSDLLVLALPLLVGTVLPLLTRAYRQPLVRLGVGSESLLEGESTGLTEQISSTEAIDVLRVRVTLQGWLALPDGGADCCTSVGAGEPVRLTHRLETTRWGRGFVDGGWLSATTAHGLLRLDAPITDQLGIRTVPLREGFSATDLVPTAAGIVGGHRSRRTGEGIDLAGVRPFAPGDRLRGINWKVSTRTDELHVNATYSDRDTEVVLVLDTSVDVGYSGGITGSSSTIDLAVRAAAAIAEHYLRHGDRVGLLDLSRAGRPIRSRTGRNQLNRLMDILLDVRAAPASELSFGRALSRISPRALVIVLCPLLGDELPAAIAGLARTGRSVVVVDTLPAQVLLPERGDWTDLAWRLQLLQRENLTGSLAEHGVPVVPWLGTGSLDRVLTGLSRVATAPRVRR